MIGTRAQSEHAMRQGSRTIATPLLDLISRAHSPAFAELCRDYVPDDIAEARFTEIARSVLQNCLPQPGACTIMSALFAARLAAELDAPVPVIAGALKIRGRYIFGSNAGVDGENAFSRSDLSWDGHVWILFGKWIADISLARTALSGRSHPLLEHQVRREFGPRVGLIAFTDAEARRSGFLYLPRYVLNQAQVTALAAGAAAVFDSDAKLAGR